MAVKEKIRIRIKGYDHQLVDQSAEKIVATAKRTGARVSGPVPLPTERQIITILRAVHKYKDSREQFETRTHKRLIDILRPSTRLLRLSQVWSSLPVSRSRSSCKKHLGVHRVMSAKSRPITLGGRKENAKVHYRQEDRYDSAL